MNYQLLWNRIWLPTLLGGIVLPFVGWKVALFTLLGAFLLQWLAQQNSKRTQTISIPGLSNLRSQISKRFRPQHRKWFGLGFVVVLPFLLPRYPLEIVILAMLYVLLAFGLNIIVGLSGLLALGFIAFYAVGAYTYALVATHWHIPFFAALPLGFISAGIVGFLLGLPVLRLRGDYLAIVTLGFGEITRIVLNNWDSVTGGPNGILMIPRPQFFGISLGTPLGYYFIILGLVLLTGFFIYRLIHSPIGRAWLAIREDELAAASCGIPVVKFKLFAFALGAAIAGLAGVFFAGRMTHISPESFTFMESIMVLCMVILGGMGSLWGVALGALVLIILPELLRELALYRMLLFGIVMILMMRFRPQGLLPATSST